MRAEGTNLPLSGAEREGVYGEMPSRGGTLRVSAVPLRGGRAIRQSSFGASRPKDRQGPIALGSRYLSGRSQTGTGK